jgi:hypothetical protein
MNHLDLSGTVGLKIIVPLESHRPARASGGGGTAHPEGGAVSHHCHPVGPDQLTTCRPTYLILAKLAILMGVGVT